MSIEKILDENRELKLKSGDDHKAIFSMKMALSHISRFSDIGTVKCDTCFRIIAIAERCLEELKDA